MVLAVEISAVSTSLRAKICASLFAFMCHRQNTTHAASAASKNFVVRGKSYICSLPRAGQVLQAQSLAAVSHH